MMNRTRPSIVVTLAFAVVLTASRPALAQTPTGTRPGLELIVPSGTVMPTGTQQDEMKRGGMTAIQASYGLRPDLVLTSTFGWARMTPRGLGPEARLHLFTYDAGVEYRLPRRSSDRRFTVKPFAGAGAGARTHRYRHVDVDTTHHLAAYVSAGAELGLSRVRLRMEARNYRTWRESARAAASSGNDVAVLIGVRVALRAAR